MKGKDILARARGEGRGGGSRSFRAHYRSYSLFSVRLPTEYPISENQDGGILRRQVTGVSDGSLILPKFQSLLGHQPTEYHTGDIHYFTQLCVCLVIQVLPEVWH